jgi:nitroreductase
LVEFQEVIRRRSMVRSFSAEPIQTGVVEAIMGAALQAPSAGNTGGTAWVLLRGEAETARYWDATTDAAWRDTSPRWAGLRPAPVVALAYSSAGSYVDRYGEADKEASGLGAGPEAWPVPYWTGDAAFGVMTVLLGAVDAGLGACFLGNFRGEDALGAALGVPEGWHWFGAVVMGRPDGEDHRSPSLDRTGQAAVDRLHFGSW